MSRNKWSWVAGTLLLALPLISGCVVRGQAHGHVRVRPAVVVVESSPLPPTEVRETAPPMRSGYVWISGRWEWNGNQWVWAGGHWQPARSGYVWIDGHWEARGNSWHWVDCRCDASGSVRGHGH